MAFRWSAPAFKLPSPRTRNHVERSPPRTTSTEDTAMPFAARHRRDPVPSIEPLPRLVVRRVEDADFMAALQGRAPAEMARRLAAGHRAYVAWRDGEPAAWGWVATRIAEIGELGTTFSIPGGERYLWNFVTLAAHRGQGIYPRLLDAIARAESDDAERFWIAYAPENHASGAGIRKAGFVDLAELSFDADGRAALRAIVPGGARVASRVLGIPATPSPLAPCWRCVRAGRGGMSCAAGSCRCDYQVPTSGCAA
jgi:ribosomal protein S18 acetylase RimI-like enzyme